MKKILLLIALPFVFIATLTAQITQIQADEVVMNRMSDETKPHNIFAKEAVQTDGFSVVTSTGETLELEYSCLVYYVKYNEETNGKYLIVKESNGNLLEVNTKNDTGPDDLILWRLLPPIDVPYTKYSLDGTSCQWVNLNSDESVIIINSDEELENYIHCTEGTYPEIDFSKHTLLLANGKSNSDIYEFIVKKLQLSLAGYELNVKIILGDEVVGEQWAIALVIKKIEKESSVELKVLTLFCEDELFYYFLNEKLFIGEYLLHDTLVVGYEKDVPKEEIKNYLLQTGLFKKILLFNSISNWVIAVTQEQYTCTQLKEIFTMLKQSNLITHANYIFRGNIGSYHLFFYLEEFFVYLKNENDLLILETLTQETNTKIIEEIDTNMYLVGVTKYSNGNALQMANYFHESGKFNWAHPSFWNLIQRNQIDSDSQELR